jgi:hypothetical protein
MNGFWGSVRYVAQIVWETPGYISQTFLSGEAADSIVGPSAGAFDYLIGTPMTSLTGKNRITDAGPLYGNQEAFQNGRVVGNVAGFAVDVVLTLSGISGVISGVRAIQSAGGLIQVAQQLTKTGQTINVVIMSGQAVVAIAETLASLGMLAEAAAKKKRRPI